MNFFFNFKIFITNLCLKEKLWKRLSLNSERYFSADKLNKNRGRAAAASGLFVNMIRVINNGESTLYT
jgi:hypothetical protein